MENIIYIVGMGPGQETYLTPQARRAIEESDCIVGYTTYAKIMKEYFPDKKYLTTGMKQELQRCQLCFELAREGKRVALICSGDAGVYGMASPMYELLKEEDSVELVVIPGITAALSGAALLGAPLNHDFCIISLSDLLTPWETIEKRLRAAVEGDFAIALYNPSSHKRSDYLKKACQILLEAGADESRACGYVENIGREGQQSFVCTLAELMERQVNMFTTVFIGNSMSYQKGQHLITKRGYHA